MLSRTAIGLLLLPWLAAAPRAQDHLVQDQIDELGIKYKVHKKLKRIPLKLGESHPNLRARYEPIGPGDNINGARGAFAWSLKVYEFKPDGVKTGKPADKTEAEGKEPATRPEPEAMVRRRLARTFDEFVTSDAKDDDSRERTFDPKQKGTPRTSRVSKKLTCKWWQYRDVQPMTNGQEQFQQPWFKCAAVYDLGDREIALVSDMPGKDKLDPKHLGWAQDMLLSLALLKEKEKEDDLPNTKADDIYRFAETPERKQAIDAARANIADLDNWSFFATKNFIVLYSWPKPDKKKDYLLKAKDVAEDMDRMRELYREYYPPPEKVTFPYSVLRICSTSSEFHKYGGTPGQVAGWFSPNTKELVLFNDREITKAVAFHEGWHQYSDAYFGGSELHRWFDEGQGDFFGSFEWNGQKWVYEVSKMRKLDVKGVVTTKKFVPVQEIVTWNKDKFYGPGGPLYYAQGYALVDFLMRGKRERPSGWEEAWGNILEVYRKTMLEQKNQKKAIEAAFTGVDWDKFTQAWVAWVKNY